MIGALDDPEADDAIERYAPVATRIVGGGQERSALFAIAYVSKLAPRARSKSAPTVARALDGVLVTAESPVARSPVLRLKSLLSEGVEEAEARQAAASYARGLATGDLQSAERGGLQEAARASAKRVKGWRKVLSSSACPWCVKIADGGGRYKAADTVPFHARDECGVAPVFEEE